MVRLYAQRRRHRTNGELAFHYCHVPEGQMLSLSRLIRTRLARDNEIALVS
jgi:hypothetical protein